MTDLHDAVICFRTFLCDAAEAFEEAETGLKDELISYMCSLR